MGPARGSLSQAVLDGSDGGVVQLAGDTRRQRFLTASSKVSQDTSGRRCGGQGELSPRAVVTWASWGEEVGSVCTAVSCCWRVGGRQG